MPPITGEAALLAQRSKAMPIHNQNSNVHISLVRHYDSEDACDDYVNSD